MVLDAKHRTISKAGFRLSALWCELVRLFLYRLPNCVSLRPSNFVIRWKCEIDYGCLRSRSF